MEYRAIVQAVLDSHPEFATNPDRDDAKSKVLPFVVDALNTADAVTGWGVLVKTDQGDKIPGDIVVWRGTMQHYDVMTDTGAIWDEKGVVTNPAWVWRAPGPTKQPPIDIPPDVPPTPQQPPITVEELVNEIAARLLPIIQEDLRGIYDQNERIFANLTAQNQELKSLIVAAPLGSADGINTVHISRESIERIASVGIPLLSRLLKK